MRSGGPLPAVVCTICLVLATGPNSSATAAMDPPGLCEAAARQAAAETGVPLKVLQAIALAESGRNHGGARRPWPWTVNFGGPGFWYDSSEEAQLAISERQALGATNFDVGCFQINHRWHGDAFETMAQMFDPAANARYAAGFLMRLYQETGSWPDAAAAYHSRTPEHAEAYRERFLALHDGLEDADSIAAAPAQIRQNMFPLLQSGGRGALASLVPQQAGGAGLFGRSP
jgi:hypothetical protein